MEIKDIYRMQLSESNSVAVNQYGTNLCKYKYDPLAVIEAKFAMASVPCEQEGLKDKGSDVLDENLKQVQEAEEITPTQEQIPSLEVGTQYGAHKNCQALVEHGMGEDREREHNSNNVNESNDNMFEKVVTKTEAQLQEKQGVLESNLGRREIAGESPNWNVLEDEEMTELDHQDALVEKPGMEETATKGMFGEEGGTNNKDEQAVRQSERIRNQGLGGAKIADKASMMAKKKNLEGNNIQLKNSFAVLDNLMLINKFGKMGGDISNAKLENFDLLKDLEVARNDLRNRAQTLSKEKMMGKMIISPLRR
jgi:hypothetical protein